MTSLVLGRCVENNLRSQRMALIGSAFAFAVGARNGSCRAGADLHHRRKIVWERGKEAFMNVFFEVGLFYVTHGHGVRAKRQQT